MESQREAHDKEKADYIRERQVRLGHVAVPEEPAPESKSEEKPKAAPKPKAPADKKE